MKIVEINNETFEMIDFELTQRGKWRHQGKITARKLDGSNETVEVDGEKYFVPAGGNYRATWRYITK